MNVFDYLVGDARVSLVTEGSKIKYVVVADHHFTVDDFEKMYQIYIDFDEEDQQDDAD